MRRLEHFVPIWMHLLNSSSFSGRPCVLPDEEINEKIRSLNMKQREIFDVVLTWATKFVKIRNTKSAEKVEPLHVFLTGQGGCGKSHENNISCFIKIISL